MRNAVRTLVLTVAVLALWAQPARADTYTQTKYPIVLAHGMAGFDSLFGVLDYFYGIESTLKSGGAKVYITHVPQFNTTEARGEALLAQVQDVLARSGAKKVNLIGHSHGGLDVRYVAAVRPDLVASVTTVGSPHKGADLADYLRTNIKGGSFTESVLGYFASNLGTVLGLLSGHTQPQDAIAALGALTKTGTSAFTAKFPAGIPTTSCGSGAATGTQGQRYYSWSGTDPFTNILDASDYAMKLSSFFYSASNDGLVGRCSSHFGTVIRDNYDMNHLDEVNQVLGLTAFFTDPKAVFRTQANRLKTAGL
ncbi:lipase family alpha/beta hydrolase [Corallococcus aberystwythensis]|uniref:Triacylglycerol lipase n=1 Tax=Corallococcus aberystwythensis TaxID=2316722 RepID=A0A3A8QZH7_9BACT|nr:triacylglycerol lipase [Corallococcus aberystwythensis]RKH73201.1 triacylglycerol lipase [Corallococcus aberystwythensis]